MLDAALVGAIAGPASELIQKFKSSNIVTHEGLIINHDACEAEYRVDLHLGDIHSRTNKLKNSIFALFSKSVTFDALGISGVGLPYNEDLQSMGILQLIDKKATIDFPQILTKIQSNLVIIYITNKISSELRDKLIHRQIIKTPRFNGAKLQSNIELVLDYGNMWYSKFVSFSVRNIIFNLNLNLNQEGLSIVIPDDIKTKLEKAGTLSLTKDNARKYLREFQEIVLGFQSKDFLNRLEQLIMINPTNCKILDITPSFRSINLGSAGYSVIVPSEFKIKVEGKIEDKEIAVNVVVSMDTELYTNLLRQEFQKLKDKTKKFKF